MPVMKRLTVDGVNYDTVGEASVTQVQTSGTKIATVTIDGTATDLYAPEGGGGGPKPSSTTPAMDGTAAVGTATTYARADHRHPTDTSRQATLVSGTNIKTVNGTSILGSGNISTAELPAVTASDIGKVLMVVGGVWQVTSLPFASSNAFGVVKVDGTTITATDGVISTAGGSGAYEVTITLTNPVNAGQFSRCTVLQMASSDPYDGSGVALQTITSPTGSETYEIPATAYGLMVTPYGVSPYGGSATCTGGVTFVRDDGGQFIFSVTGDGTATIDGVDYDD